jgi:predicted aldo/keto reductase-like oxidoreductase
MQQLDVLSWAERAQADGRIGELAFSFHDDLRVFKKIVDAYDWAFCQIQYNLVGEDVQAGTQGVKYAASKGMDVVVMEPLFGGTLANPPQPVWEIWQAGGYTPADVALRWLWDKPEVSLVLSGMSTMEQVQQNVDSASRSGVGWLDERERVVIQQVQEKYSELSPIPCTRCGYCLPCPHGVNVPLNFQLYNDATVFRGNSTALCRNLYLGLPEDERAQTCEACGTCEDICPQGIAVGTQLQRVAEHFR